MKVSRRRPPPVQQQIANLITELNARHDALVQAEKDAKANGITGITIEDAVEFNSVDCARTGKTPCMLTDVIPKVKSDLLSYSSYETLGKGVRQNDLAGTIATDIQTIHQLPGLKNRPLIIGEFGFSQNDDGDQGAASNTQIALTAFSQAGISLAFDWQIKDSGNSDKGFGLVNADGTDSASWSVLKRDLTSPTRTPVSGSIDPNFQPLPGMSTPVTPVTPAASFAAPAVLISRLDASRSEVISRSPMQYTPLTTIPTPTVDLPALASPADIQSAVVRTGIHAAIVIPAKSNGFNR